MSYDPVRHGDFCTYLCHNLLEGLAEYGVVVSDDMDKVPKGIAQVTFTLDRLNHAYLKPKAETDTSYVNCYYLPWIRGDTAMCTLDENTDARLFFTSHLNGCRLSIKYNSADRTSVQVIHIAGDIKFAVPSKWGGTATKQGPQARDMAEEKSFGEADTSAPTLRRRLSFTKDYDRGSAFVLGARTDSGAWVFLAQLAKGSLSSADLDPNKNIEIVNPYKVI